MTQLKGKIMKKSVATLQGVAFTDLGKF